MNKLSIICIAAMLIMGCNKEEKHASIAFPRERDTPIAGAPAVAQEAPSVETPREPDRIINRPSDNRVLWAIAATAMVSDGKEHTLSLGYGWFETKEDAVAWEREQAAKSSPDGTAWLVDAIQITK